MKDRIIIGSTSFGEATRTGNVSLGMLEQFVFSHLVD
jgi:hypothetical protein